MNRKVVKKGKKVDIIYTDDKGKVIGHEEADIKVFEKREAK